MQLGREGAGKRRGRARVANMHDCELGFHANDRRGTFPHTFGLLPRPWKLERLGIAAAPRAHLGMQGCLQACFEEMQQSLRTSWKHTDSYPSSESGAGGGGGFTEDAMGSGSRGRPLCPPESEPPSPVGLSAPRTPWLKPRPGECARKGLHWPIQLNHLVTMPKRWSPTFF